MDASPSSIVFSGSQPELLRVLLRNSVFNLLTLGLYRFWAITNLRRFYWKHVQIDSTPFTYRGRGGQIFLGTLIGSFVVIILINLLEFFDLLYTDDRFTSSFTSWISLGVLLFGFLFLFHIARALRWRFLLAKTDWRAIRASFPKPSDNLFPTLLLYSLLCIGLFFLAILTCGLTMPLIQHYRFAFLINRSALGTIPATCMRKLPKLFYLWLPFWSVSLLLPLLLVLMAGFFAIFPSAPLAGVITTSALFYIFPFLFLASYFLYSLYKVQLVTYFLNATFLEGVFFQTETSHKELLRIIFHYHLIFWGGALGLFALTSILFGLPFENNQIQPVPIAVFVMTALLMASFLRPLFFLLPLAQYIALHTQVKNIHELQETMQAPHADPAFGEGLAETLDVEF